MTERTQGRGRKRTAPAPEQDKRSARLIAFREWAKRRRAAIVAAVTLSFTSLPAIYLKGPEYLRATLEYYEFYERTSSRKSGSNDRSSPSRNGPLPLETGALPRIVRERSISDAIKVIGTGSFAEKIANFNGALRGQTIGPPGWKGVVSDLAREEMGAKQSCLNVRDPTSKRLVALCSIENLAHLRANDAIRFVGTIADYPPTEIIRIDDVRIVELKPFVSVPTQSNKPRQTPKSDQQQTTTFWEKLMGKPSASP
jgi:hypothetical protein